MDDGRTGWEFTPGDAADLAAVLATVIVGSGGGPATGAAGRVDLASRFDWGEIAERTDAVYRGVRRRRPRAESGPRLMGYITDE